ncbi:glycoside hydrolase superfamily [Roridomyces roridus]|uniref:Beta-xylanase n=1 Tax=Roridomyces roridus TaxID=1738132 RepID=A0AAD7BSG8_9AGAR|nr:glycoside hydrolase superfamily [Roridomyces roridus]
MKLFALISLSTLISATPVKRQVTASIDNLFKNHGKTFLGVATDEKYLTVQQNAAIAGQDFGAVTPENSMKWAAIEPSRGVFNFTGADYLVNWAVTNGKSIRGHNFVWGEYLPNWVLNITDAQTLIDVLQNHITQVLNRYQGLLYAFDVINEPLNQDGSLKSTHWTQVIGPDVFRIALEAARAADPSVKLYINDYTLDWNNTKVAGMVNLVNSLNPPGQPPLVDGIGSQAHLNAGEAPSVHGGLVALSEAGVDIAITELDIPGAEPSEYQTVVQACISVRPCVSLSVWGIRDPDSYRPTTNPLLFDESWQAKPAYNSIAGVLNSPSQPSSSSAGGSASGAGAGN